MKNNGLIYVNNPELAAYKKLVKNKLSLLNPFFVNALIGDFDEFVDVPEEVDEFTELYVGIKDMLQAINEKISELNTLNNELNLKITEQDKTLTKLLKSKTLLKNKKDQLLNYINSATDVFALLDNDLNVSEINKSGLQFFNVDKKEIIGKKINALFPYINYKKWFKKAEKVITSGKSTIIDDVLFILKNENKFCTIKLFKISNGVGVICSDNSTIKNTKKDLVESEEKFRTLTEYAPNRIFVVNENGIIKYINRKPSGYNDLVNTSVFNLVLPQYINEVKNCLKNVFLKGEIQNLDIETIKIAGEPKWFTLRIGPINKSGKIDSAIIIATNISEKIKYLNQINNIARFPDEDPNPIMRFSGKGHVLIYSNKSAENIVKFLDEKSNYFVKRQLMEKIYLANSAGMLMNFEFIIEDKVYVMDIVPIISNDYVNIYAKDITLIKEAEKELVRSKHLAEQSVKAKEQFLANMSHEVRTPLNAIMGLNQLLYETKPNVDQKKLLDSVNFATCNLLNVINEVLDFSQIDSSKFKIEKTPFDIHLLIYNIVESMKFKALEKKLGLTVNINKLLPRTLIGDPFKLNQVLNNLIDNALKFTEKGHVKIDVSSNSIDHNVFVKFLISDTGIGIKMEHINSIFNTFYQVNSNYDRAYGGVGLGLAIVKKLTDLMEGTIKVTSIPDKGTKINIKIPFKVMDMKEKISDLVTPQIIQDEKPLKNIRVLVVEDNQLNQMVVERFLISYGAIVDKAENGEIAINKLLQASFDIILMDIQMPKMDGIQATQHIRNNLTNGKSHIPIMAMTAHAFESELDKCISIGMNDFITKPLKKELLKDKIQNLINKKNELI